MWGHREVILPMKYSMIIVQPWLLYKKGTFILSFHLYKRWLRYYLMKTILNFPYRFTKQNSRIKIGFYVCKVVRMGSSLPKRFVFSFLNIKRNNLVNWLIRFWYTSLYFFLRRIFWRTHQTLLLNKLVQTSPLLTVFSKAAICLTPIRPFLINSPPPYLHPPPLTSTSLPHIQPPTTSFPELVKLLVSKLFTYWLEIRYRILLFSLLSSLS